MHEFWQGLVQHLTHYSLTSLIMSPNLASSKSDSWGCRGKGTVVPFPATSMERLPPPAITPTPSSTYLPEAGDVLPHLPCSTATSLFHISYTALVDAAWLPGSQPVTTSAVSGVYEEEGMDEEEVVEGGGGSSQGRGVRAGARGGRTISRLCVLRVRVVPAPKKIISGPKNYKKKTRDN